MNSLNALTSYGSDSSDIDDADTAQITTPDLPKDLIHRDKRQRVDTSTLSWPPATDGLFRVQDITRAPHARAKNPSKHPRAYVPKRVRLQQEQQTGRGNVSNHGSWFR